MSKISFGCKIGIFCIVPPFYKDMVTVRGRDRQKYGTAVRYRTAVQYCKVPQPYRTLECLSTFGTVILKRWHLLAPQIVILFSEILPDLCPDLANSLWTVHEQCLPKLSKSTFWRTVHEQFIKCSWKVFAKAEKMVRFDELFMNS